jgi:hypothetical protein
MGVMPDSWRHILPKRFGEHMAPGILSIPSIPLVQITDVGEELYLPVQENVNAINARTRYQTNMPRIEDIN